MNVAELAFAHGGPAADGVLRAQPEDFIVAEELGFSPEGSGEHVMLHVRKRGANTDWVARELARFAGVRPMDVSYAGLKDRHAITTQWFSLYLPGRADPDWSALRHSDYEVLAAVRHSRKLRRGALQGNRFVIRVRELRGDSAALQARLAAIAVRGVPNYFGEQRFGREGGNVAKAEAIFAGTRRERDRNKRGLYLSSARSFLFNTVLAERVAANTWDCPVPGECFVLDGSGSFFCPDGQDGREAERLARWDIHPSGPLWGRGPLPCRDVAAEVETRALAPYMLLRQGLEAEGMAQERRPLRLRADGLQWSLDGDNLTLAFALPAGAYATTVLREAVRMANQ